MASRSHFTQSKKTLLSIAFFSLILACFAFPSKSHALEEPNSLPSLSTFIASVQDGNHDTLRGVYVAGIMAFPIIQQPMGNPGYVSSEGETVTQFSMASEVGNLGLLAHNHLAGANFARIQIGDIITLIYGDGHTQQFEVQQSLRYQAFEPFSPNSNFKDLTSGEILAAEQLFNKVYRSNFHLTLQTCIAYQDQLMWGRLFIIAVPVMHKSAPYAI